MGSEMVVRIPLPSWFQIYPYLNRLFPEHVRLCGGMGCFVYVVGVFVILLVLVPVTGKLGDVRVSASETTCVVRSCCYVGHEINPSRSKG